VNNIFPDSLVHWSESEEGEGNSSEMIRRLWAAVPEQAFFSSASTPPFFSTPAASSLTEPAQTHYSPSRFTYVWFFVGATRDVPRKGLFRPATKKLVPAYNTRLLMIISPMLMIIS
jgi:hypothetical protein